MTTYLCTVLIDASSNHTIEAESPEAAAEKAEELWGEQHTGLCHQCAREVDMGDCYGVLVTDAEGTKELLDTSYKAKQIEKLSASAYQRVELIRKLVAIIDEELLPNAAGLPIKNLARLNDTLMAARELLKPVGE